MALLGLCEASPVTGYAAVAWTPQPLVLSPASLSSVSGGELEGGVELLEALRVGVVVRSLRADAPEPDLQEVPTVPGDGRIAQVGPSVRGSLRFGDSAFGLEPHVALGYARWLSPVDPEIYQDPLSDTGYALAVPRSASGAFLLAGGDLTLWTRDRAAIHLGGRAVALYTGFPSVGAEARLGASARF